MDKKQLVEQLENLEQRLQNDVIRTLIDDYGMGYERWESWVRSAQQFFESYLPNYLRSFEERKNRPLGSLMNGRTRSGRLIGDRVNYMHAFIKSIIMDIINDDYIRPTTQSTLPKQNFTSEKKAFIVHGSDEAAKERTARFLEKLSFEAIILHEQASGGKTIIEKLEKYTDVGFGIVLYTPDDVGEAKANKDNLRTRARQNVVFEHGLLIGKLGRERVFPLVTDHSIELPNDISGMVYMSDRNWEVDLAKEIKALGYSVDLNVLF